MLEARGIESARKWTGAIIRECNLTLEIAPSLSLTSASWRNPFAFAKSWNNGRKAGLSLSALAHNRTRITTRGGEKAPVHNSHAWWTLLVFVRFMLCHATRSSLSIDACVRRSEGGGVGGAILEENSCPIYLSGIIDRPYRVGREDIKWWAKEGRSGWTRVYGYFIILDFLKSIYMLYYMYIYILYVILYLYVNIDSRIDYSF